MINKHSHLHQYISTLNSAISYYYSVRGKLILYQWRLICLLVTVSQTSLQHVKAFLSFISLPVVRFHTGLFGGPPRRSLSAAPL